MADPNASIAADDGGPISLDHSGGHSGRDSDQPVTTREVPFHFHGNGGEFFRIWIVNLLLTIVTLGIYSAWAKVRTKRYFYGNTELDGDRFDYLANPITILKGRLIAVAALVVYTLVSTFAPLVGVILLVVLFVCLPWIVVRSLRFNAVMSAWRGVRFGFDGTSMQAFVTFVLWQLFGFVTLGFGMPYAWYKQNQYMINNHRFGRTNGESSARASDFYVIFFVLMGVGVGAIVAVFVGAAISMSVTGLPTEENPVPGVAAIVTVYALFLLAYIAIYAVFQAMYFHVVYDNICVSDNRVRNSVTVGGYFRVVLVNSIMTVLTLGIFYPWAAVRMSRYLQSNLWVEATDLGSFVAHEADQVNALGDELGEAFDLGIGL